jgi:hypothetical protein
MPAASAAARCNRSLGALRCGMTNNTSAAHRYTQRCGVVGVQECSI